MNSELPQLPEEVKRVLSAVGWTEDRDVSTQVEVWARELAPGFTLFSAAREALRRFGGIVVQQHGPGVECARETFNLCPVLAVGEADRFQEHAAQLDTELYPLGEGGNGHVFLAISPEGRVFALMEDVWLVGDNIGAAIEALVRGLRSKRL